MIDFRRVMGVREIVHPEPNHRRGRIGVDEKGALDMEIEAGLGIVRRAAAALYPDRPLAGARRINNRTVGYDLKAGSGERRVVDDELPVERVGACWQP